MKNRKPPFHSEFLRAAYLIQLRKGSFSGPVLARETGKSYGYTSNNLKEMLSGGLIKRVSRKAVLGSGGRSNLKGLAPAGYILTMKGRSEIRVVLSGGVFDIIHPGHIAFLKEARVHGDVLVTVLARDSTVRKRRGRPPLNNESDRLSVLSSLRPVDLAILGSERSFSETIERVSPDTIFLGYDQREDLKGLAIKDARVVVSEKPLEGYSTSRVLEKIKGT